MNSLFLICFQGLNDELIFPMLLYTAIPYIIWIIPERSHLIGNAVINLFNQFHQSFHILNASILEEWEVYLLLFRIINNFCLKELWKVEDDAEDDDGDDVDGDSSGDTSGLCYVSVCVRVADWTVSGTLWPFNVDPCNSTKVSCSDQIFGFKPSLSTLKKITRQNVYIPLASTCPKYANI